jgi:hypothetical protein
VTTSLRDRHRVAQTAALTLIVLPLLGVPSYFVGQAIANSLDHDRSNGVLALGLILGVAVPAVLSAVLARSWGELRWPAAVSLGIGSGVVALAALFMTFVAVCTSTTCVV